MVDAPCGTLTGQLEAVERQAEGLKSPGRERRGSRLVEAGLLGNPDVPGVLLGKDGSRIVG